MENEKNKYEIIHNFRKCQKEKISILLNEELSNKLKREKEETGLSKTEIVNYALYKYFKENSEGDQDE